MIHSDSSARWIWLGGEKQPKNFYLYSRKTVVLDRDARQAAIDVTADSRYILFVNGVQVARGPARCDRRWQCLDRWDMASFLRRGPNVLGILVHHYGEWTFSYMQGRGGLLAEVSVELVDGSRIRFGTDATWRLRQAMAWEQRLPRMSIQLGYPEVFDARRAIDGWQLPAYDDRDWERATVVGPACVEPWPNMAPREIPAMVETSIAADRILDTGELGPASSGYYVDLLRSVWSTSNAVAYLATFVWTSREGDYEIHAGSQDAIQLWVNTSLVVSHCISRDPGPDQEIVNAHLNKGWNTILAKIVQGEGQWHFYFRMEGVGSDRLVYAEAMETRLESADGVSPWWIIGPFESESIGQGFARVYPPEDAMNLDAVYTGKGGREIRWISAGVTKESSVTSVVMSREPRFPFQKGMIEQPEGLIEGPHAVVHPGADCGVYAVVDFGKEVTGYPVIEIGDALGGEIIDLGYGEVLQTPSGEMISPASGVKGIVNPDRAGVHYADRYICKPGNQRFQTFDKRAFRYLQVDIRNVQTPITVGPVSLIFSTYPVEYRGRFTSGDTLLNRIWEIGRWTVQLSMEDAYSDSPWRERAQWWGDVRLESLVACYCFGDARLTAQGLRHIAQSQMPDGLTKGIYPTEWEDGILPTYTLLWVVSLFDYVLYTGDRKLVAELLPVVDRVMSYFTNLRSDHGLLKDVPYWPFVDWTDVETLGESAAVNALYFGALIAAASLTEECGAAVKAVEYRTTAVEVQSGMDRFLWDSETSCYKDSWKDGKRSMRISEQANCWAVVFGIASGEKAMAIMQSVFTVSDVKVATPYFAYYAVAALAKSGMHEKALEYIRRRWKPMVDWGATTWWETWEPKASFCHGWSSGPTYFLQSEILGIKPLTSGWGEILVEPHPGNLDHAEGVVPTPLGPVSVTWTKEADFLLEVVLPAPALVIVPAMKSRELRVVVIGGACDMPLTVLPSPSGHARLSIRLQPGSYRIHST